VIILNNIVAYNYVTGIMTKGCKDYSHNLLFENGFGGEGNESVGLAADWGETMQYAGCMSAGTGDFMGDPLFVNPDKYDFGLQGASPAIDAGSEAAVYNDAAFPPSKGTSRNDMGATGGPYAVAK
jgi:hypothetical protein